MRVYTFLKIIGCIAIIPSLFFLWCLYKVYFPLAPQGEAVTITIEQGKSVDAIAQQLTGEHVVSRSWLFVVYVRLTRRSDMLQAGSHDLFRNSSVADVARILSGGDARPTNEVRVTIPEGLNSTEIQAIFNRDGIEARGFDNAVASRYLTGLPAFLFDGRPAGSSWEGYLFPDTYNFFANATGDEILTRMVQNLVSKIDNDRRVALETSSLSFFEVLTLASIVEKELRTTEERRIGAGVFLQRLRDNYPLESDATINFITNKGKTRPSYDDLATESRYNTYTHKGLPPGPITNPSLDAIDAVLHPTQTDDYYFLTTPDGHAVFSKTFDEHLKNKAQYYP